MPRRSKKAKDADLHAFSRRNAGALDRGDAPMPVAYVEPAVHDPAAVDKKVWPAHPDIVVTVTEHDLEDVDPFNLVEKAKKPARRR